MTNTGQIIEKRSRIRHQGAYAEYAIVDDHEKIEDAVFESCFLRDYSLSGASLMIYKQPTNINWIVVHLYDFNSVRPIVTIGRVVWNIKKSFKENDLKPRYDIGIQFTKVEKNEEQRLNMMIMNTEAERNKPYSITDLIQNK